MSCTVLISLGLRLCSDFNHLDTLFPWKGTIRLMERLFNTCSSTDKEAVVSTAPRNLVTQKRWDMLRCSKNSNVSQCWDMLITAMDHESTSHGPCPLVQNTSKYCMDPNGSVDPSIFNWSAVSMACKMMMEALKVRDPEPALNILWISYRYYQQQNFISYDSYVMNWLGILYLYIYIYIS